MTTAATTDFTHSVLEVEGYTFVFDGNSKVTAGNGDFDHPQANAFSLVQVKDCPMHTPTCADSCYVHMLEKFQPEIHAHYVNNSKAIRDALDPMKAWEISERVEDAFAEWIEENASGGFRWHVSGDVYSRNYASFIANVAEKSPDVPHWIYTRSFNYVSTLLHPENLTVNISADKDNYWLARRTADKYDLRVCYLTVEGEVPDDLLPGDVIFPDYALRGVGQKPHTYREGSEWWKGLKGDYKKMVCPVDVYGKSEKVRCGPCRKCIE